MSRVATEVNSNAPTSRPLLDHSMRAIEEVRKLNPKRAMILGAVVVTLLVVVLWRWHRPKPPSVATYVGQQRCAQCHKGQVQAWRTSHHAQAMQAANDSTVLGNFSDAHFVERWCKFQLLQERQQVLRSHRRPRRQAAGLRTAVHFWRLSLAAVSGPFSQRPTAGLLRGLGFASKEQGGQRWFDLYPDQKISPTDPLHWTGGNQTWNYMCADCHSTNLRKNYDLANDSYATKWSEIDVSCESCHGPGSNHVDMGADSQEGLYKDSETSDG